MAFETLAQRVVHILAETKLSPAEIARVLGCKPQAIYQWQNGETKNIKMELLFALADLTGFEARWIATGKGPQRVVAHYRSLQAQHVASVMENMPADTQTLFVQLVDKVAADPKPKHDH